MDVYYEGVNITGDVLVKSCVVRDTVSGRCDGLEIVFEDSGRWFRWGPKEDDRIIVRHMGYDSGVMYVNTVTPEDGRYRILATSLPCLARRKEYRSFKNRTVGEIINACASNTGMQYALYGVNAAAPVRYIEQGGESAAAFLYRLLTLEGAAFKCVQGRYTGIGILWAQEQNATQTLELAADQLGVIYQRGGDALRKLVIVMPGARVVATDTAIQNIAASKVLASLPVSEAHQAGRWARGLLLSHNRKREILKLDLSFRPSMTAMIRIDVRGGTDADGPWLTENVEHDLINEETSVKLYRCVSSII